MKNLIIDSFNLFTRHYVAHPAHSSNGDQIGGIVGYLYELCRHIENFSPDRVLIIWEGGGSTKKRGIYKDYKNNLKLQ